MSRTTSSGATALGSGQGRADEEIRLAVNVATRAPSQFNVEIKIGWEFACQIVGEPPFDQLMPGPLRRHGYDLSADQLHKLARPVDPTEVAQLAQLLEFGQRPGVARKSFGRLGGRRA